MTIARCPVRDGMVAEMDDVAAVLFGRDGAWGNSVPAAAVLARAKEVMRERRGEHDRAGVDKEGGRHPLSVVRDDVGGRRQDGKY